MDMTKPERGTIEQWVLNTLSVPLDLALEQGIEIKTDKVYILSGYVVEDPSGRFEKGWHFRSSIVLDIDSENGIVETSNSIYRLKGERHSDGDLGDFILKIFY